MAQNVNRTHVNRTAAAARCSWRWMLEVPDILAPAGIVRTLTCSRRCLFYHYCTKLFMGLNFAVLTELLLSVYGNITPILGAYLVLQGFLGCTCTLWLKTASKTASKVCATGDRLAKALMSLLYLVSGTLWLLLRPFLLTQTPMRGPFLWEGSGDPRATMGPSVASNAAWGAVGGVGWAEGRHTSRSSSHSGTLQHDFILGSSISPSQQNMCFHGSPELPFPEQWGGLLP